MRLHRVVPWTPKAAAGEPGDPMHVPIGRGRSRIDNPAHYRALYFSDAATGAVAEVFGSRPEWSDEMFDAPRVPGSRRALVTYDADPRVLDLDEPRSLMDRRLRPSRVASRDRTTTQAWALNAYQERAWDGLRWWSVVDSRWAVIGLWSFEGLRPLQPVVLTRDHPAVAEAAAILRKRWAA